MNINSSHEEHEISGDEKDNFAEYMDENGIIGLDDQGDLGPEEERILEFDQELILGLEEHLVSYPEALSDEEPSGTQSLEQFSFSQIADETNGILQDNEALTASNSITDILDTDGHSLEDHPDASLSLPPPTDWRPPSRDQQLDMTEDEQDGGTSLDRSDEDEESWGHEHSDLQYDNSPSPERFQDYSQTVMGEEQWDSPSVSSWNYAYPKIPAHEVDIPSILSVSPSPHPMSKHWAPGILSDLGRQNMASCIEDETLPESSCTDSGEASIAAPSGNRRTSISQAKAMSQPNHIPSWSGTHHSSMKPRKSSTVPIYGRGQLNYPLPDFSKVGPRVRFPRDEGYCPPQPKRLNSKPQRSPSIFKSPAEIVREVLMSSSEKPTQEHATQRTVPAEFQSPQQATDLVHQLQEDYNKLLTKYAEAENTIDRLRLGAKVNLYSDPPKPSHSVPMGTVFQGSKVMEFTIPQAQRATFSSTNDGDGVTEVGRGPQTQDHHVVTPIDIPQAAPSASSSSSPLHPSEEIASTLSSHISELNQEVALLEELRRTGKLNLEEQQQALWELRGSLDVLERRYLRAREGHHSGQPHKSTFQDLDPERALEGAIFQLGLQLDELQENIGDQIAAQAEAEHKAESPSPVPSSVAPIPAVLTPYPEISQSEAPVGLLRTGPDAVTKVEAGEELPQTLHHTQMQVEKEHDTLFSTYNSFKTLPDSLGLDQDEWPKTHQEDAITQDNPLDTQCQDQPQEARPLIFSLDTRPSHTQLRKPSHETPGQDLEYESVPYNQRPPSRHKEHQWFDGPQDYHSDTSLKGQQRPSNHRIQLQPSGHENHMHPTRLQSSVKIEGTSDIGTPRQSQPHTKPCRLSHDQESLKFSLDGGRPLSNKSRVPLSPKVVQTRVPRSSPSLSRLKEESPRSSTHQPSIDGENAQSARSNRSSISSKSASSSINAEKTQHKNNSVQRRIISPETDSGFLGSESGRSPQLQRQRNGMKHHSTVPVELPTSSNSSPGRSRTGELSRPRRAFREKKQQNGHGTRFPPPISPSPGPNSLTESENQDQSQISESDSEKVESSDALMSDPYFGAPFLLSPIRKHSQPHGNFLETRTARDQAIQDLQKEVVQLRKRLENSLNCTPARWKANEAQRSITTINPQEEKVDHFESAQVSSFSDRMPTLERLPANSPQRRSNAEKGETVLQPAWTENVVHGAYTGTSYSRPEDRCNHCRGQVTTQPLEHIPSVRRSTPVPPVHTDEGETSFSEHFSCTLCHSCRDSPATQRNGMIKNCTTKRGQRSLMGPHGGQWIFNKMPPLSYLQTPFISSSPPVIPSPYIMLPAGYSVAAFHSPYTVMPHPVPGSLQLEDLRLPLDRALEAAKELKITSKRMCRSLTSDLSLQHTLRRSCLF